MIKILLLLLLSFIIYPLSVAQAFAAESFTTSYNVTYSVQESGITHAVLAGSLKNTTGEYYASSYTIDVGFLDLKNIVASDPDGVIIPEVTDITHGKRIKLPFNKRVVGKESVLPFTLSFDTTSVANKHGKIWEIDIPGIANQNAFDTFTVHVSVPSTFGTPSYIKPAQADNSLTFTKEQLGKSGVSMAFGESQIYDLNLGYHIKNDNVYPVTTEIALPSTTNYQTISIDEIVPKPSNVVEDADGNWIAEYSLSPSEKKDITVKATALLSLVPKKTPLSDEDVIKYTKPLPYWQVNSEKIKTLSKTLTTPLAIYEYVAHNLTYDFSRVSESLPRLGAEGVLEKPTSAVCLEYTDLFIALARANGIPAREVDGFAFTANERERPLSLTKDILHAWPEYYDKELQTWIMIDPTWASTTHGIDYFSVLDFDHIVFVRKGVNSAYPVPAGGYKLSENDTNKDVDVSFASSFPEIVERVTLGANVSPKQLSALPIRGDVTLQNAGNTLVTAQEVEVASVVLNPKNQKIAIGNIPPFGHVTVPFYFDKTDILTNKSATVTISLQNNVISKTITISPFSWSRWGIIGGISLALLCFILSIIARRARHLSVSR